jgi:hypothetical protein
MDALSRDRAEQSRVFRVLVGASLFALVFGFLRTAAAAEPEQNGVRHEASAQLGVALAAEAVADAGDVCPDDASTPCILRAGGGVGIRVGYRAPGRWYVGGAYEFSRHDSSSLLRLAILQQLRAEARYYFDNGNRATPFLAGGFGLHVYGSDWTADTGGLIASFGGGITFELTPRTAIGCMASYRMLLPRAWTDAAGERRADGALGFGLAHLIGLELTFDVRDPVPHW